MQGQKRAFSMHPRLLMDVIKRQAGTLTKSILELVMNSVDAGSSTCQVTVSEKVVVVSDDGKGITSKEEIEKYFECFGQPHDASENKVYGTFRIGRGQAFSFGYNYWRTGTFAMHIDVKDRGLDYTLEENLEPVSGCTVRIDLYESLVPGAQVDLVRELSRWVRYMPISVTINGEDVTVRPEGEEWDHETEDAYIRLTARGTLAVYNQGVHVTDIWEGRYGVGGTVVSKKPLLVNFARNDIQSSCPVWRRIVARVESESQTQAAKKPTLSKGARQRMADLVSRGAPPLGAAKMALFTAVNGRHYSAEQLIRKIRQCGNTVTSCAQGDRTGDRIFQANVAFVLAEETIERFGKTCAYDVVTLAYDLAKVFSRPKVVEFDTLTGGMGPTFKILTTDELKVNEKIWFQLMTSSAHSKLLGDDLGVRKLVVGVSSAADGWTDGASYVAVGRDFLKTLPFTVEGFTRLGLLLVHEYCHDEDDANTHVHQVEFYQSFHDRAVRVGMFAEQCLHKLPAILRALNKKVSRMRLRDIDSAARIRNELATLTEDQ